MDPYGVFEQLGLALGLGLLVGLQRERVRSAMAGFRTFPLITMLGTICALLAQSFGGWIVAVGFGTLAAMIVVGNIAQFKAGEFDPGLTTEITMLLMFGVGAYLVIGQPMVAVAVTGSVVVLLYLKPELHSLAARIGEKDFRSIMIFVVISLVILPVLPNQAYGPYQVLNPHKIWLLVVLIVGISLGGYVAYKILGEKAGTVLGGVLGGLISSTATTVSYARRSRQTPGSVGLGAIVIMIASTVVFLRVLLIVGMVAPVALLQTGPPMAAMLITLALISVILWRVTRHEKSRMPEQNNPTELKSALFFALVFAVVLFATAAAKDHFGERGLYVVAALSGLTDMDAITLSTAQMINDGKVQATTAWRLILLAAMSNLVFKGAAVAVLGNRKLLVRIALLFGVSLVAGGAILAFWPRQLAGSP